METKLAIAAAKDGNCKSPHVVLIDDRDFPVAIVYGRDEQEATELGNLIVQQLAMYEEMITLLRRASMKLPMAKHNKRLNDDLNAMWERIRDLEPQRKWPISFID